MIRTRKRTAAWTKLNSSAAESSMPCKPPFLGLMRLSSSSPLRKSQMRRKVTYHPSLALSALARGDLAFFADYFQQRGQRGEHYRTSDDSDRAEGFQPSQQGKQNEQGIDVGAAAGKPGAHDVVGGRDHDCAPCNQYGCLDPFPLQSQNERSWDPHQRRAEKWNERENRRHGA